VRHLNLEPANLIVDPEGSAIIVDFGFLPPATLEPTAGSPLRPYAAPEQLRGEAAGVAADVFALGAIAYECLTGVKPYAADTATELAAAHRERTPAPLPDEVAPAVATLVMKALATNQSERFTSAALLATDAVQINLTNDVLGALLDRRGGGSPGPPDTERAPVPASGAETATEAIAAPPSDTAAVPRPGLRQASAPPPAAAPAKPRRRKRRRFAWTAIATVAILMTTAAVALATLTPPSSENGAAADGNDPDRGGSSGSATTTTPSAGSDSPSSSERPGSSGSSSGASSGSGEASSPGGSDPDEPDNPEEPERVTVPDVVGDSPEVADRTLKNKGLEVTPVPSGEGRYACPVTNQDPNEGASVPPDTKVKIEFEMAKNAEKCGDDGGGGDDGGDDEAGASPS
ncbi:MAG: protein kinase domain-containing protein, partial [Stackebrandtia sp.]